MKFTQQLKDMLTGTNFNVSQAVTLSMYIHTCESTQGYVLTPEEEKLWIRLSIKIQNHVIFWGRHFI